MKNFRTHKTNIALVVDEYGVTQGLITLHDLIENILGELPEKFEEMEQNIISRKDGTLLIDGSTALDKLSDYLSIEIRADEYTTMRGFIMERLRRIPVKGGVVNFTGYEFEVIDMDAKRVDKVLAKKSLLRQV